MATTSGYVEVGPGKTFTTWSAMIADLGNLTGDLTLMQTGTTSDTGTALNSIDLNGYTLTLDSATPHGGVAGVGNVINVPSNPSNAIIKLEVNGTGLVEVKNLQVNEFGLTDTDDAFQIVAYDDVDVKVHDLIAVGSYADVQVNGAVGIAIVSLNGNIDAWNLKAYFWNDTGIGFAPGYFGTGSGRLESCTAYLCSNYGILNYASFFGGGGVLINNVAIGSSEDFKDFNVAGYVGYNNASEDATAADGVWSGGGSGNQTLITPAAEFKSLTYTEADFLMVASGGVLEGSGTAVAITDNTAGIRGNDRPGTDGLYSIGADEYGVLSPTPTPPSSSSSSSSAPAPENLAIVGDSPGTNLGRSLLLNANGAGQPALSFFGQEYVSPSYVEVALPSGLRTVRRMLFGSTPDQAGLNYSVWQFMRILHSTPFESYITDLDPRITYLNDKSLVGYSYGATVSENNDALQFLGAPTLGGADGRLNERWKIEQIGAAFRITSYRTRFSEVQVPSIDGDVTSYMPMTGHASFKVRVLLGYATQSSWEVEYMAKPSSAMDPVSRAAQLSKLSAEAYLELFPRRDPYNLFRQLWEQHSEFAYKMSGVLLALIYRTQEIRNGG